jgi:hypothetical protein
VVDDDGRATATDCDANRPAPSSIQSAVEAAQPGSTILICPGTYADQVVVTKNDLTVRGTGPEPTVLRPSALPVDPGSPAAGAPRKAVLLVNGGTGVTIANLTIDGSAADGGSANFSDCSSAGFTLGLYYRNSSGTVDATHSTKIRSAARCSAGIFAESGGGGATNLEVKGSTVDSYGMNGVVCNGQRTACSVTGNTLRGRGRVDDQVQLGLVIRFGATAAISANVIRDHYFTPTRDDASIAVGLLFLFATPEASPQVLRETNTFIDNELDLQRLSSGQAL